MCQNTATLTSTLVPCIPRILNFFLGLAFTVQYDSFHAFEYQHSFSLALRLEREESLSQKLGLCFFQSLLVDVAPVNYPHKQRLEVSELRYTYSFSTLKCSLSDLNLLFILARFKKGMLYYLAQYLLAIFRDDGVESALIKSADDMKVGVDASTSEDGIRIQNDLKTLEK